MKRHVPTSNIPPDVSQSPHLTPGPKERGSIKSLSFEPVDVSPRSSAEGKEEKPGGEVEVPMDRSASQEPEPEVKVISVFLHPRVSVSPHPWKSGRA